MSILDPRINQLLDELEIDYLEHTIGFKFKRKHLDDYITNIDEVKALIWDLLTDPKYRRRISYQDYSDIWDILMDSLE